MLRLQSLSLFDLELGGLDLMLAIYGDLLGSIFIELSHGRLCLFMGNSLYLSLLFLSESVSVEVTSMILRTFN